MAILGIGWECSRCGCCLRVRRPQGIRGAEWLKLAEQSLQDAGWKFVGSEELVICDRCLGESCSTSS